MTETTQTPTTTGPREPAWLTQEAYDRLKAELDHLSGPARHEIAQRIEAAREEGDLKENGGYHAAKEEQGKQEGRIRQLTQLLRDAEVGQAPSDSGKVQPGMVVVAEVAGQEMRFLFGSREIAEGTGLDVYSPTSPLGESILGLSAGDEATYKAPNGRKIPVKVVSAEPFTG
ncbi:transcription elongation factor GreA [Pseudokineococcus basanitobsidens]|uniref:Transcription elongation factor GreA n=1 Tax=Pseudokineococcus basanitobsidens TaxID=1926649 RepID=A0ABU8RME9_9ACTN